MDEYPGQGPQPLTTYPSRQTAVGVVTEPFILLPEISPKPRPGYFESSAEEAREPLTEAALPFIPRGRLVKLLSLLTHTQPKFYIFSNRFQTAQITS